MQKGNLCAANDKGLPTAQLSVTVRCLKSAGGQLVIAVHIIKKTIIGLLCVTMSWASIVPAYAKSPETLSALNEQYPDAKIIHVSREEYPALASWLAQNGYQTAGEQVVLSDSRDRDSRDMPVTDARAPRASDDCDENQREAQPPNVFLNISNSTNSRGGGNSEFVFVVIGAIVVVVWTIYAVKYLVDLSVGRRSCGAWSDVAFSSSWGMANGGASNWFGGVRYLTGVRSGSTDLGLSGEIGQAQIHMPEESLDVHGLYWLLGPLLRWHMGSGSGNPHYFQMEFLAGTTEHDEVGVIAQAKVGFNFAVGDNFRWGVNIGALNINLSESEGVIGERSQYHSMTGLEWGYRF